jgi:hypothetical protein
MAVLFIFAQRAPIVKLNNPRFPIMGLNANAQKMITTLVDQSTGYEMLPAMNTTVLNAQLNQVVKNLGELLNDFADKSNPSPDYVVLDGLPSYLQAPVARELWAKGLRSMITHETVHELRLIEIFPEFNRIY